jgi:hypothetical protein
MAVYKNVCMVLNQQNTLKLNLYAIDCIKNLTGPAAMNKLTVSRRVKSDANPEFKV